LLLITPWERSLLQTLSEGKPLAELALTTGLSEHEIQQQLSTLCSRMGAASAREAVTAACRRGLIPAAPILGASPL
jgi:DNA-binding NarL/FixJ family response regulator